MTFDLVGFLAPFVIYGSILALHTMLPARHVEGYACDAEGVALRYRLNGMLVLLVSVSAWGLLGWLELVPFDALYEHRWGSLAGAFTIGTGYSIWVVVTAESTGKSLLEDLFLGRIENPQYFDRRVDAKMFLYLVGAVMLELNLLSFAAHHYGAFDDPSPGVALYVALLSFFVLDYLTFERVHLYTYDLFAERVGFKLGWGCLVFYPYFYCVGLWSVADLPDPGSPSWLAWLAGLVFFTGWACARGANMQKFAFKADPNRPFLGVLRPGTLSDGERTLLCNGFWGVSRHVNYLGEVLMATGTVLALGHLGNPWPWLYPLYYVLLLGTRERDDDRRCAAKYGPLWERYREQVPYRIIPGIY